MTSRSAHLVLEQRLHVSGTYRVRMAAGGERTLTLLKTKGDSLVDRTGTASWWNTPGVLVSPEDLVDAALTEAMSTLSLPGLTQDQPAGLAAVFGFWGFYKVISESSVKRQETCRDT